MTDEQYDILKEFIEEKFNNKAILEGINGSIAVEKRKATLPYNVVNG